MHITCVKGSPIFRSFLIFLLLVASGFGFVRLTSGSGSTATPVVMVSEDAGEGDQISARYFLTLSAEAREVVLNAGMGDVVSEKSSAGKYEGELLIDTGAGLVDLNVLWAEDSGEHHFAKLVIEAEGEKTFTHVFDASGRIEDFIELPF